MFSQKHGDTSLLRKCPGGQVGHMFPNWGKLLSHTHGFLSTYPEGHLALVCCMVESNNEHLGSCITVHWEKRVFSKVHRFKSPSPTVHLALPYVAMSFLETIYAQVNVPQ